MENINKFYLFFLLITLSTSINAQVLDKSMILNSMTKVNDYWISQNPDYGDNRWYSAVYYMGNMAMYKTNPDAKYLNYSLGWATKHNWALNGSATTTFADNHAAGQTYIDLYNLENKAYRIAGIQKSIDNMLTITESTNWYWIDALFMAMPAFSKLGALYKNDSYFEKMHELYLDTKNTRKLYNQEVGLWYRDDKYIPPYKSSGGKDSFWSRGNGWVYGALTRVLQDLPRDHANRAEYIRVFKEMSTALLSLQRSDGFWNVSLVDPTEFGGPETSGTSLFTYGMAWGINNGILEAAIYKPVVEKAWNGLATIAVQENGKLGYVQGRADRPSAAKYESTADYGVGAFLLAGSEMYILASSEISAVSNIFNESDLSIFPNPSSNGQFQLSQELSWEVYSAQGLLVKKGNDKMLDLSNQSKGIFFLKTNFLTKKMMIQ